MTRATSTYRKSLLVLVTAVLVGVGLGLGLPMVQAQNEDPNQPLLDYRQRLMVGQRASMASIGDMLKYKMAYSPEHFRVHAKNISDYAKLIPDAFEKKISEGLTDAKPELWQNWDDFVARSNTLSEAAGALAAAADSGDARAMMPHVKALGDACRGCHNDYRKPEEDRFPRN